MSSDLSSLKDLAEAAGMDARTAGRILRDAGVGERSGRRFPKAEALAVLARDADPVLLAGHAAAGRGAGMSSATASLASARAGTESLRGRKLAFDLATKQGEYLRRDRVESALDDMVQRARDAFLDLGTRAAPKLVGITDLHRLAELIEIDVRAILATLADPERIIDEALS